MHNHQSARAIILAAVASERQPVGVRIHSARPHGHAPHARTPRAPRTPCTLICERSSGTVCGFASRCRASRASSDYSQLASPGPFEGARALVGLVERASRFTPGLAVHGLRTALGCRGRGADCSSRSSSVPTTAPTRGAGASEPDTNMVQALVGGRVPAAAGRRRGCVARKPECGAHAGALARWRAWPCSCSGIEEPRHRGSRAMRTGPHGPRAMVAAT